MEEINLLQTIYLNPGIVSAESSLCATIHWSSSCVLLICSPSTCGVRVLFDNIKNGLQPSLDDVFVLAREPALY